MLVAPLPFEKPTSLRAAQVAGAIARGLAHGGWEADLCPLAVGGAGTEEALLLGLGGEARAGFSLVEGGGTAVTEDPERLAAAAASGAAVVVLAAADLPTTPGPAKPSVFPVCRPTALVVLYGPATDREAWKAAGATLVDGATFVLDALGFDERMRAARAVVLGQGTLATPDLRTTIGELATRARQAGVPAHAIVGESRLSLFEQRILDLQHVLEADAPAAIEAAAQRLAGVL